MSYTGIYCDDVVRQDIPNLSQMAKILIKKAIEERLAVNPIAFGKPLRYSLTGHRSLRVSDYRVVYKIAPLEKIVSVVAIRHRKDVHEK